VEAPNGAAGVTTAFTTTNPVPSSSLMPDA